MSGTQRDQGRDKKGAPRPKETKMTDANNGDTDRRSLLMRDLLGRSTSLLVLGGSGTGKTSLAKSVALKRGKNVFLVGGDPRDYEELDRRLNIKNVSLTSDELVKLQHATLIIEDHFAASSAEHSRIRYILSYMCRHRDVTVLLLTHSLLHTSLLNTTHHFRFIVLTASPGSRSALTQLASKTDSLDAEAALSELENLAPFEYLVVNGADGSFEVVTQDLLAPHRAPAESAAVEERRRAVAKGVEPILKQFPEVFSKGKCLLDYVLSNLGADVLKIHPTMFTIEVTPAKTGQRVSVSLADFLVVAQQSGAQPSQNEYLARRFLAERMVLPLVLIANRRLLARFKNPQTTVKRDA